MLATLQPVIQWIHTTIRSCRESSAKLYGCWLRFIFRYKGMTKYTLTVKKSSVKNNATAELNNKTIYFYFVCVKITTVFKDIQIAKLHCSWLYQRIIINIYLFTENICLLSLWVCMSITVLLEVCFCGYIFTDKTNL